MYPPNYPTDSVLKRHFDSAVGMKRQMWLQIPPTDSTLRRHALSVSRHLAYRSSTAARISTSSISTTATAPTTQAARAAEKKRGVFARLFGLFTRSA